MCQPVHASPVSAGWRIFRQVSLTASSSWPRIVTKPRSLHLGAYLHNAARKNVALCMHVTVTSIFDHPCGVHGALCPFFWFVFFIRQTFPLLVRCLAKLPQQLFARPSPSPPCLCSVITHHKLAWAACKTERRTSQFECCAENRLGSSPALSQK